jgi:hypothetical protein
LVYVFLSSIHISNDNVWYMFFFPPSISQMTMFGICFSLLHPYLKWQCLVYVFLSSIHISNDNVWYMFFFPPSISQITMFGICFFSSIHISNDNGSFPFYVDLFLFSIPDKTFTELDYISNTTSALLEAGTAYYSLAPELTPVFWWALWCSSF